MKGWTVRTESTKNGSRGVAGRQAYLHNHQHKNHNNTEHIETIFGGSRSMSDIAFCGESYAAKQAANGRGGRPPTSYAVEFTLNLPKGYRPNHEQWVQIVKHCLVGVATVCDVDRNEVARTSHAVLHKQDQNGDRGTGDHVHLVVGKFTDKGKYLRNLQRKTATAKVKQVFNSAAKKVCGYDWTEYAMHLQKQKYPNKKPVPTWRIRAAREQAERAEQAEQDRLKLEDGWRKLNDRSAELESLADEIDDKFTDQMALKRLMGNFSKQADKWLIALENSDLKQLNRQRNRIERTVEEVSGLRTSPEDEEFFDRLTRAINEKKASSSKAIPTVKQVRHRADSKHTI